MRKFERNRLARFARSSSLAAVATAALLVSASAAAEPAGKEQSVKGDKPQGGSSGASGGATGGANVPSLDAARTDPDKLKQGEGRGKPWEASAGWEGHRLVRQSDLEGAAPDKYFNYYFVSGLYDITKYDRVSLTAGLYQRFLADPGETGARLDDIIGSYRRWIPLPAQFDFYGTFSVLAPTSFVSFREGLITAPRVALRLDKRLGEYVTLSARTAATYFWQSRNTMREGTSPNPLAFVSGAIGGDVAMPFHKPLSAGVAVYTGYGWYHNATSTPPPEPGAGQAGVAPGGVFDQQPISQSYGGEVHVNYLLPDVVDGLHVDATVAYAQGDPTLGYTSTLHDGVSHFYLFYRLDSEVFATLTARY